MSSYYYKFIMYFLKSTALLKIHCDPHYDSTRKHFYYLSSADRIQI